MFSVFKRLRNWKPDLIKCAVAAAAASACIFVMHTVGLQCDILAPVDPGAVQARVTEFRAANEISIPGVVFQTAEEYIPLAHASTYEEAKQAAETKLGTSFPFATTNFRISKSELSGDVIVLISASRLREYASYDQYVREWLIGNMGTIVPQNTPYSDVPNLCAAWIAAQMKYDSEYNAKILAGTAYGDWRVDLYNEAWYGFANGTGVCSTYAAMFRAMVAYVPINPVTMQVDYLCQNAVHMPVFMEASNVHAWNVVDVFGQLHYYDVCWFDTGNNDMAWLDFPAAYLVNEHAVMLIV